MKPRLTNIDIDRIRPNPNQPRRIFAAEELAGLTASIAENGLLQPITVRKCGLDFELIAGERRLRAAKQCGMRSIPCIISDITDEQSGVLALVENIERANLNFFEEAEAILRLIEVYGLTQAEVAVKLSKKQSTIANKLRLLKLSRFEREQIINAKLSERHARALLKIDDEEKRVMALKNIISKKLKVEAAEHYIEKLLSPEKRRKSITAVRDLRIVFNTLDKAINLIVSAGVPAKASHEDKGDCIVYTVRIPKNS